MKKISVSLAALVLMVGMTAGCGQNQAEMAAPAETPARSSTVVVAPSETPNTDTGKPLETLKVGGMAVCAVCAVKEGTTTPEHVKATLDYKGKTYGFCDESEKAEFISAPAKYALK